ncbi:TetR/AcrR family transcriptional regulator [Myxococcus sp. CA051A]|uniref:TetR/AcrR family transcriptional regulator n=1 Tax=unclassified Myxococcus TaxID=2648731 RepID=UPI00157B86E8|nr:MULTISPECIES: TetR/AcrR family transcriptional regulator [unclassified Myxococcus]NTX14807.1 TetR/AcrR family transcriptional regulator [Myxococcus sp. CA056]NTX40620.1 TetR/AcrR family transcriptional regulator [Myxococcus sp. CA033]NTX55094.1 TetR/AcrR family transcriptional regulator [Myxococcus sp. CA039A]NTX66641.1 TetR/AcrR family transcriptional regulator [Myxococcus sp. CA051A]
MSTEHRTAILAAATESFARLGFSASSLEDIARRAGLEPGRVHGHFESKEALFAVVVRQVWCDAFARIEQAVARAPTPETKVAAFVETRQEQVERILQELHVSSEALLDVLPRLDPLLTDLWEQEVALLESALTGGNTGGGSTFHDPKGVALALASGLRSVERTLLEVRVTTGSVDDSSTSPGSPGAPSRWLH